jgi:hypothetical protein
MVSPATSSGGAVLLGKRPGWRSSVAVGTPNFSCTTRAAITPGLATRTVPGSRASPARRSNCRPSIGAPPAGHLRAAPERVPEVGVGEHPGRLPGRHERGELQTHRQGARAVRLRGREGGAVAARPRRGAEAEVREHVAVGAERGQECVHGIGPRGGAHPRRRRAAPDKSKLPARRSGRPPAAITFLAVRESSDSAPPPASPQFRRGNCDHRSGTRAGKLGNPAGGPGRSSDGAIVAAVGGRPA